MNRATWRILLTCVLLVALPFKGIAAAGMPGCGPDHHSMHDASGHEDGTGRVTPQAHADGEPHPHVVDAVAASGHDHFPLPAADKTSVEHDAPSNGHFKCGTCAPCCVSAMLTGNAFTPAMARTGDPGFPAFTIFLRFTPPGRLERPPRPHLA